jgi:hypothetical protein
MMPFASLMSSTRTTDPSIVTSTVAPDFLFFSSTKDTLTNYLKNCAQVMDFVFPDSTVGALSLTAAQEQYVQYLSFLPSIMD